MKTNFVIQCPKQVNKINLTIFDQDIFDMFIISMRLRIKKLTRNKIGQFRQ